MLLARPVGAGAGRRGIYTCIDAKGRRLTADRPIAECIDREQKELSPSGTVKRQDRPGADGRRSAPPRKQERSKAMEERSRLAEEKKRDRALLARYPDQAAHDKERADGPRAGRTR